MQSSTASLTASILCVMAVCTAVQSLGGRVFDAAGEHKEDKFVTDPSANVDGKFLSLRARLYSVYCMLLREVDVILFVTDLLLRSI